VLASVDDLLMRATKSPAGSLERVLPRLRQVRVFLSSAAFLKHFVDPGLQAGTGDLKYSTTVAEDGVKQAACRRLCFPRCQDAAQSSGKIGLGLLGSVGS